MSPDEALAQELLELCDGHPMGRIMHVLCGILISMCIRCGVDKQAALDNIGKHWDAVEKQLAKHNGKPAEQQLNG